MRDAKLMDKIIAKQTARLLSEARLEKKSMAALPSLLRPSDESDAYLVQGFVQETLAVVTSSFCVYSGTLRIW